MSPITAPNVPVDAAALVPHLQQSYDLPQPLSCSLIRRGFNDTYLVESPAGKHVFRLYFNHKYWISGPGDLRFELELLRFVHARGVAVAAPIPRRDGDLLGVVPTASGDRCCALFAFADGATRGPIGADEARTLGRTLGEFHRAADAFRPGHPTYRRYVMDLRYLLDQPFELIDALVREHGRAGLGRFQTHAAAIRERVLALPRDGGRYGVIHGDPHRGNAAVTDAGSVTLFDFDHGGFGWRAYDLAVCWRSLPAEGQDACLEGYASARALSPEERALLPTFRTLNAIWDLGDVLAMRPTWGAPEQFGADFARRAEQRLERLFGAA